MERLYSKGDLFLLKIIFFLQITILTGWISLRLKAGQSTPKLFARKHLTDCLLLWLVLKLVYVFILNVSYQEKALFNLTLVKANNLVIKADKTQVKQSATVYLRKNYVLRANLLWINMLENPIHLYYYLAFIIQVNILQFPFIMISLLQLGLNIITWKSAVTFTCS